jgi:hypothetical protein
LLALLLCGCNVAGPAALSDGRSAYNSIVNQTEDEQLLTAIVRSRYDQTFGLLAVTGITANIRVSSSLGVNAGIGPRSSFEGNLVPLSAGAAYEENPTISYVPVRGEQFVEKMLAPLSADQTLLLARMSTPQCEPLRLLLRRVNGLANPLFAPNDPGPAFDRFVELFTHLRRQGVLDVVRLASGAHEVLVHDFDEQQARDIADLLAIVRITSAVTPGEDLRIPLRFFVGAPSSDAIEFETPSALEILRAAARGVEAPDAGLSQGAANEIGEPSRPPAPLVIHVSPDQPRRASIRARHEESWYYIDERDTPSKQAFVLLRTLVGMRLDGPAEGAGTPVLTVPVGR